MKKVFISVILFLAAAQTACRYASEVSTALRFAESQMEIRPDSALAVLEGIDPHRLTGKAIRARHALLYSQALDKNYIDLQSDSVIAPAVAYYSDHGTAKEKAYTNYYLGCVRYNAGNIDKAVQAMVAAVYPALETNDSYLLARLYGSLGCMYLDQHSLNDADSIFCLAEKYYQAEADTINFGYVLMNKAKVYALLGCSKKSQQEFLKARTIFEYLNDQSMVSLATRSLVHEMVEGESETADSMKQLLTNAYVCTTGGIVPAADYTMWARIYFQDNCLDSARHYGELALSHGSITRNQKCGMILWMSKIESRAGNYRKANEYWEEYYVLFDSLIKTEKEQLIQEAEKRYHNQELVYANELLRIKNVYTSVVWGVILVLSLTVLIFVFVRRVRRYRQFIETLNDNYDAFKNRYLRLSKELSRTSVEEVNLLNALERLLGRFQRLLDKGYNATNTQNLIREFKEYAKSIGNDESIFSDLQYVVNKRYFGLVDHLHRIHPNLTEYEINMLCMIQMDFSFNCIRLLHQHENVYSLYSRRTKIHKKLGLVSGYKLEEYLAELVRQLEAEANS